MRRGAGEETVIGVCLSGARGRMGRMLAEMIAASGRLEIAAALERPAHPELGMEIAPGVRLTGEAPAAIAAAEVVLDFSLPEAVIEHLGHAVDTTRPFVTGTTGFSPEHSLVFERAAKKIAVVRASNMSRGVYVLGRLVGEAARALKGYDAEVFEMHHAAKADAPSGTALQLAEGVCAAREEGETIYGRDTRRRPGEVGISSARGGDVVGEHRVMFLGDGEQIILTHRATSRRHFCAGALAAAEYAAGAAPGLWTMQDVFAGG